MPKQSHMENAFQAEVMRENGDATYWVGKNHDIPVDEFDMGSSKHPAAALARD